jgi:hypothetical protein
VISAEFVELYGIPLATWHWGAFIVLTLLYGLIRILKTLPKERIEMTIGRYATEGAAFATSVIIIIALLIGHLDEVLEEVYVGISTAAIAGILYGVYHLFAKGDD